MRSTAFLGGLATGLVSGLFAAICLAYLLGNSGGVFLVLPELPTLSSMLNQVYVNLRGALVPFLLVLVFYFIQVVSLRGLLQGETQPALELVLRREQLIDLAANLFFGIGVIWTAIGMRAALIAALGDPSGMDGKGAFIVLQRLVDGGILLALSTTIVGGIGGYLMRVVKALAVGRYLGVFYVQAGREPYNEGLALLQRIDARLDPEQTPP